MRLFSCRLPHLVLISPDYFFFYSKHGKTFKKYLSSLRYFRVPVLYLPILNTINQITHSFELIPVRALANPEVQKL